MELYEFKANPGKSILIRIPGPEEKAQPQLEKERAEFEKQKAKEEAAAQKQREREELAAQRKREKEKEAEQKKREREAERRKSQIERTLISTGAQVLKRGLLKTLFK